MADTFKGIITADGKKRQLPYRNVIETPVSDETLSIQGAFADAKVVGDNFKKTKAETDSQTTSRTRLTYFFAVGRITEEQYNELMDINKEEEPKV